MDKKEVLKNIKKYMEKKNKEAGKELISFGSTAKLEIQKSGIPMFDETVGGIPYGGYTMLFGPPAGGKSTTAFHIIAQAQRDGKLCAYIDAERSFLDGTWARICGVDVDELLIVRPNSAETALDEIVNVSKLGINLVVFDSVVALATEKEIDRRDTPLKDHTKSEKYIDLQSAQPALLPRQLSKWFAKSVGLLADNQTAVVFINQIRMDLGGFNAFESFPGGNALRHYILAGIKIRRNKEEMTYTIWKTKLNKNEGLKFTQTFIQGQGIDLFESSILALQYKGLIKAAGVKFTYQLKDMKEPKTVTYLGNLKNTLQSTWDSSASTTEFMNKFTEPVINEQPAEENTNEETSKESN